MNYEQLKNSILQEAIEGRLVKQDPNDEPAAVLLDRIADEKKRLIKEKKIKRDKNESRIYRTDDGHWMERFSDKNRPEVCIDDEIPFDIPESWEWQRWGNISVNIQYGYNAPAKAKGIIKMVRISDIQNNKILWATVPYCDIPEKDINTYILKHNDILFARTGGTVGKSYLVKDVPERAIYAGYLIRTSYFSNFLLPQYLKFFMESSLYWQQLKNGTIATAQPNCNGKTLSKMLLPIPPLSEQHRIVSKLEEVLPKVEEYGKAQDRLDTLNSVLPEKLKASILQEAIEGRLVPQNPEDEPASKLLDRIAEEKAKLVKEKKIKADKNTSRIYRTDDGHWMEHFADKHRTDVCIDDEINFDIPSYWELARLSELSYDSADGRFGSNLKREHYTDNKEVRIIQLSNIGELGWKDDNKKYTTFEHLKTISRSEAFPNDIIIAKMMPAGRAIICPSDDKKYVLSSDAVRFSFSNSLYRKYLYYAINSNLFKQQVYSEVQGITRVRTSLKKLRNYILPIPPYDEQIRIVQKIERLLPKLNSLK